MKTIAMKASWIAALVVATSLGFAYGATARAKGPKSGQPSVQPYQAPQSAQQQSQTPEKSNPPPKQPHMQAALKQLQAAQYDLSQTSRGKGGWVEIAQGHVNSAISAVSQGIAYGQSH